MSTETNNQEQEQSPQHDQEQSPQHDQEQPPNDQEQPPNDQEQPPPTNDQPSHNIKHLVLGGGSMKGLGYIGAYKALLELNLLSQPLESIVGCSIGSFTGLLIILGYTPQELYSFVTSFNYNDVKEWNFVDFFSNWGIESGKRIRRFFAAFLRNKTQHLDLTFDQLYQKYPTKLTVVVTNLRTHSPIYYNHENTPNQSVITAICRSINLPYFFAKQIDGLDCYVDGALVDNFPIQECPDHPSTLGICFLNDTEPNHSINNLEDYSYQMFNCMFDLNTKYKLKQIQNAQVLKLQTGDFNGLNMHIDVSSRQQLHDQCYQQTLNFFNQIDQSDDN